jgi:hypothetical protein
MLLDTIRIGIVGVALVAAPGFVPAVAPAAGPGALADPKLMVLDYSKVHFANHVRLLVTNQGLIGSTPGSRVPYASQPSAQWPDSNSAEYLYVEGPWIGALLNGEPHVTTAAYTSEFRPGTSELDRIYATYEGAAGGNRRPSPDADDDHDGRVDEDWLDGRDNDHDGRVDEDFAAISNQMFFCEYADTAAVIRQTDPTHVPLSLAVQQSSLAWSDPDRADFIGFDYRMINVGFDPLDRVFVGMFADCDIGMRGELDVSSDDEAGFWEGIVPVSAGETTRNVKVSMGYMWDADGDAGRAPGWIGFVVLGAQGPDTPGLRVPLSNFRMFSGRATFESGGEPTDDAERYQVLDGTAPLSLGPPDSTTGFHTPVQTTRADDYRILVAAGPVETLAPGDTLSFQVALVLGEGFEGLKQSAARAQLTFDGSWGEITAVEVQDLAAAATREGVVLTWRLPRAGGGEVTGVRVERAATYEGPYVRCAPMALEPAGAMQFVDRDVESGHEYWYRLVLESGGADSLVRPVHVVFDLSPRRTRLETPVVLANGSVQVTYEIAGVRRPVQLAVYDVLGRRRRVLDAGVRDAGRYVRIWDGRDVSAARLARGIYIVRLRAGGQDLAQKVALLRD